MMLKENTRRIEVRGTYENLDTICNKLNSIPNSTFFCRSDDGCKTVRKKYFSDFFLLNPGHHGSLNVVANAQVNLDDEYFEFKIGPSLSIKLSIYVYTPLLILFGFILILNGEYAFGLFLFPFVAINVFGFFFFYNMGLKNFLMNWDRHLDIYIEAV